MQTEVGVEVFDPSEFEEPELYESMRILKSFENLAKSFPKKSDLHNLKKSIKKEKKREKIRFKLKRPYLDLEKMLKVKKCLSKNCWKKCEDCFLLVINRRLKY